MKWVVLVLVAATLGATATEVARVGPRGLAARRGGARRGLKQVATAEIEQATDEEVLVELAEVSPRRSGRRGTTGGPQSPRAARGRTAEGRTRQRANNRGAAEGSSVVVDTADTSQDRQEPSGVTARPRRPQPRKTRIGPKRSRVQVSLGSEGETATESPVAIELDTDSTPAGTTQDDEGSPSTPSPSTGRRTRKFKRPALGRLSLRRKGNAQAEVTTEPTLQENLTPEQGPEEMNTVNKDEAIQSIPNEENTQKIKRPSLRRRPSLKRKGPSEKSTTTEAPPVVDDSQPKETKTQGKFKGLSNRRPSLNNRASNRRNKASLDKDMEKVVVSEAITEDVSIPVLAPDHAFSRINTNARVSQNSRNQPQIRIPTTSPEPIRLTRTRSRGRQTSRSRHTTSPERTVENADLNQQTLTTNTRSSITRNRSSRPSSQVDSTSTHTFRKTSSSRRQPIPTQTERISHSHLQVTDYTTERIEESQIGSRRRDRTRTGASRGTSRSELSRESPRQPGQRQDTPVESIRGRKRIETVSDVDIPRTTMKTHTSTVLLESIFDGSLKPEVQSETEDTISGMKPEVSIPPVDEISHIFATVERATTPTLQSAQVKTSNEKVEYETQLEGHAETSGTIKLPRHRFEIEVVDNQTTIQTDSFTREALFGEGRENNHSLSNPSAGVPLPLLNAEWKPVENPENTFTLVIDTLYDDINGTGEIRSPVTHSFTNDRTDPSLTLGEENKSPGFLPDNLGAALSSDTSHLFGTQREHSPKSSLPDTGGEEFPRNFLPDVTREQTPVSYRPDADGGHSPISSLLKDTEEHSSTVYLPETTDTRHINAPVSRTSSRSRSRSRSSEARGSLQQQHSSVDTSAFRSASPSRDASSSSRVRQDTGDQPFGRTTLRDSTTQARIQHETSRGSTARERIQQDSSRGSTARGRIQHETSRGSTARGRIQHETSRGSTARGRTQHETSRGSRARGRTQQETSRSRETIRLQSPEDISHPAESLTGSEDFSFTRVRAQNLDLSDSSLTSAQSNPHQPRSRVPSVSNEQAVHGGKDTFGNAEVHPQARIFGNAEVHPQARITKTSAVDSAADYSSPTDYPPLQYEDYETEAFATETEPTIGDYLDIGEASFQDTINPMQDKLQKTPLMTDDAGMGKEMLDDLTTTDLPEEMDVTMPMLSEVELGISEEPRIRDINVASGKQESLDRNRGAQEFVAYNDETTADLFDVQSRFAQPRPVATTAPPSPSVESIQPATFTRTRNTPRTDVNRGSVQRTHQPQRERTASRNPNVTTGKPVPASFGRRTSRGRLIQ